MANTIKVIMKADGPRGENIGDGTLFYSSGASDSKVSNVNGWFLDNPPRLSSAHASVVWRYERDTDSYMLIHVQGSQLVSPRGERIYAYRAGYEVTRAEMEGSKATMASLVASLPRIANAPEGRVDSELALAAQPKHKPSPQVDALKQHITAAIVRNERLVVTVTPPGKQWRSDGILDRCEEFNTLLAAIDSLDTKLRRYATFAFCIDEHYEKVLDGVTLLFVSDDSQWAKSPGVITWAQVTSEPKRQLTPHEQRFIKDFPEPGKGQPLAPLSELVKVIVVYAKSPDALTGDEWDLWQSMGHEISELDVNDWHTFGRLYKSMSESARKALADHAKGSAAQWPLKGISTELLQAMHLDTEQTATMQKRALREYLEQPQSGVSCLFPNGITDEMAQWIDGKFITALNLPDANHIAHWHAVAKRYGRLEDQGVRQAFIMPLVKYVLPSKKRLSEVVDFMRSYPFVPVKQYKQAPEIFDSADTNGLTAEQKALVDGWKSNEIASRQFGSVDDILQVVQRLDTTSDIERGQLENLTPEDLAALLTQDRDPMAKINRLLALDKTTLERIGREKDCVTRAVEMFLFGDKGPWHDCDTRLADIAGEAQRQNPEVMNMLKRHVNSSLGQGGIAGKPPRHFGIAAIAAAIVLGCLLGYLVSFLLGRAGHTDVAQTSDNPTTVIELAIPQETNIMLTLARLRNNSGGTTVHLDSVSVNLADSTLTGLQAFDSIAASHLAAADKKVQFAVSSKSSLHVLTPDSTLLTALRTTQCDFDTVRVTRNNVAYDLAVADSLKTIPADSAAYYFELIRLIDNKLNDDKLKDLKKSFPY